jgi:hypothetical protein
VVLVALAFVAINIDLFWRYGNVDQSGSLRVNLV